MKEEDNEIVSVDGYLEIAEEEGFRVILIIPFVDKKKVKENFYILFHKEYGVLLAFDTSEGRVNKGILYYNLRFPCCEYLEHFGSGEWYRMEENECIWIGSCDCREGLILRSRLKSDHGQFITPWVGQPSLWLLHYTDEEAPGYDYKAINLERIAQLPEEIQKAICP